MPPTPPTETPGDRSGETVGARWKLVRWLGSGGMASVYEAIDASGERVAIKLLHPEMARRGDLKERFLREAYVANRIGHPGIVQVLDHVDGADVFLVIELLEGEPLGARMQCADRFTVRDLLSFTDQILDALGAAHAAGVVHRDIKPDNVFVLKDGRLKILDFGIARVIDDVPSEFKTRTGLALGTIPYMAPEQALGRRAKVDGRTDLFALGALMFRALAGRRIHEEPSEAELLVAMATKPAPRLADVAPGALPAVCAIVDRALAFHQEARYPDAETMRRDVQAVLAGAVPTYAATLQDKADEATRIEPGAAPYSIRDADTVATTVSAGGPPPSRAVVPFGVAPPIAAALPDDLAPASRAAPMSVRAMPVFEVEAVPVSLPPNSMAGTIAAAPPKPPERSRGLWAVGVFGVLAFAGIGALAVVALAWRPWEAAAPEASEAKAASTSHAPTPAVTGRPPEEPPADEPGSHPSAPSSAARGASAAAQPSAKVSAGLASTTATPGATASARAAPASPAAAPTTSAPAAPSPTAAPPAPASPTTPPTAVASAAAAAPKDAPPSDPKGGKGKSDHKDEPKRKSLPKPK